MRHHPGYAVEEVLASQRKIFDVFARSWRDLCFQLERFSAFAATPDAMLRRRRAALEDIQSSVQKEVFTLSTSAKALVDVSRRLATKVSVPGYRERVEQEFAGDGQHRFITRLRDTLNHGWFAAADWQMSFGPGGRSTAFTLSCPDMLHNGDFTGAAKKYILSAGERLDVGVLFGSYVEKVTGFYNWLWAVIDEHVDAETTEYRSCIRRREINGVKSLWNIIIDGLLGQKIDPYSYLDWRLTQEQVAEVLQMPHRSKHQVDHIISLVDELGVCDDRLREKVYSLFGVQG